MEWKNSNTKSHIVNKGAEVATNKFENNLAKASQLKCVRMLWDTPQVPPLRTQALMSLALISLAEFLSGNCPY